MCWHACTRSIDSTNSSLLHRKAEKLNQDLWPYIGNKGNGKFRTSANSGIQQCSIPPSGQCFMAYSVGFIQHFSLRIHCGERQDIAESFSIYQPLYTCLSAAILPMAGSLYFYCFCIPHQLLQTLLKISLFP